MVFPRLEVMLFYQKKNSSKKQADFRDMFKNASNSVCITTILVSADFLSLTPSTSSAMKTPENTKR
jgi:hypothetical protein